MLSQIYSILSSFVGFRLIVVKTKPNGGASSAGYLSVFILEVLQTVKRAQ